MMMANGDVKWCCNVHRCQRKIWIVEYAHCSMLIYISFTPFAFIMEFTPRFSEICIPFHFSSKDQQNGIFERNFLVVVRVCVCQLTFNHLIFTSLWRVSFLFRYTSSVAVVFSFFCCFYDGCKMQSTHKTHTICTRTKHTHKIYGIHFTPTNNFCFRCTPSHFAIHFELMQAWVMSWFAGFFFLFYSFRCIMRKFQDKMHIPSILLLLFHSPFECRRWPKSNKHNHGRRTRRRSWKKSNNEPVVDKHQIKCAVHMHVAHTNTDTDTESDTDTNKLQVAYVPFWWEIKWHQTVAKDAIL